MAAHPDSKPKCSECTMYSYTGNALRGYNVTYRCKARNGETRQWSFSASSILRADDEICRFFQDENNTDYTVIKPTPALGGGGCLPKETPIHLADGTMKAIELIDDKDELACFALGTEEVVSRPVHGKSYTETAQIIELVFSDGKSTKCSSDQFVISAYGPIRAADLLKGAILISTDDLATARSQENKFVLSKSIDIGGVYSIDIGREFAFFSGTNRLAMKCSSIGSGGSVIKY